MTVSLFVSYLAWFSFFAGLWFGWQAESLTAYQWFVIVVSFALGVITGLWQMDRSGMK
jgi:hypothetical protein